MDQNNALAQSKKSWTSSNGTNCFYSGPESKIKLVNPIQTIYKQGEFIDSSLTVCFKMHFQQYNIKQSQVSLTQVH